MCDLDLLGMRHHLLVRPRAELDWLGSWLALDYEYCTCISTYVYNPYKGMSRAGEVGRLIVGLEGNKPA